MIGVSLVDILRQNSRYFWVFVAWLLVGEDGSFGHATFPWSDAPQARHFNVLAIRPGAFTGAEVGCVADAGAGLVTAWLLPGAKRTLLRPGALKRLVQTFLSRNRLPPRVAPRCPQWPAPYDMD